MAILTITPTFGHGASNMGDFAGEPPIAEVFRNLADDNVEMRAQFAALLAKLDSDAGVTDADYASTLTPAALTVVKGT